MPLEEQTQKILDKISASLEELAKIVNENVTETKFMRLEQKDMQADMLIKAKEQKELYDGMYKNGLGLRITNIEERQKDHKNFLYALTLGILLLLVGLIFKK